MLHPRTRATLLALLTTACLAAAVSPASAAGRKALVIANESYPGSARLANPVADARLIESKLGRAGFTTVSRVDLRKAEIDAALSAFAKTLSAGDTDLVYFAGHGMEISGGNYIVGVDAAPGSGGSGVMGAAVSLDTILAQVKISGARTIIVVLDACRDDPFGLSASRSLGGRGYAPVPRIQEDPRQQTYIAFAAAQGTTAADAPYASNGPFAKALAQHMLTPGLELNLVFRRVREAVIASTNGAQVPWSEAAMLEDFFFVSKRVGGGSGSAARAAAERLIGRWLRAQNAHDFGAYGKLYCASMEGIRRSHSKVVYKRSKREWLAERRKMVRAPSMSVDIAGVTYEVAPSTGGGAAVYVRFMQYFRRERRRKPPFADCGPKYIRVAYRHGSACIEYEEMLQSRIWSPHMGRSCPGY